MPRQSVYTPLSELASLDYNYWYIIMVVTFRQSCRRGKRRKEKEKTAAMINTEIAATKEEEKRTTDDVATPGEIPSGVVGAAIPALLQHILHQVVLDDVVVAWQRNDRIVLRKGAEKRNCVKRRGV
jgi:hypothetical protein